MIELCDICKSFGSHTVIDHLNLKIYPNQVTFIVGSSGVGKSTLLNMIGGLSLPDSGCVIYDGVNISDNVEKFRAENVGFIFQNFNLISGLTVKDNIRIGALYSNSSNVSEKNIDNLLSDIGIPNSDQRVDTLSGGEKQRVAFARSVCKASRIIIADEPTGNLDSENAEKILSLLSECKDNRYIIIVSHDIDKAQKYGDRIISLKDGMVESDLMVADNIDNNSQVAEWNQKKKKKICWDACKILGINNIRRKWWRILSIALVVALTMTAIATVICIGTWGDTVSNRVNKDYLENDLLSMYYPLTPNAGPGVYPFSREVVEEIKTEYDVAEVVEEYYNDADESLSLSYGGRVCNTSFKQVNLSEFFNNRTMTNEIEGRFITNENEIIIASDVSAKLFDGAGIGEKIQINTTNGHNKELKIVGINHTVNPFDKTYTFVCASALKELFAEDIEDVLGTDFYVSEFREKITYGIASNNGFGGKMQVLSGKENILFKTEESLNDNSVLLSSALASEICKNSYQDLAEDIYNTEYGLPLNGVFKVRVAGVYESDEYEYRISQSLYSKICAVEPTKLEIYLNNSAEVSSTYTKINDEGRFFSECTLENLKTNIQQQTSIFKLATALFGIILLIISFFMLSSFAKITVLERKHEFAIVKSLGASNRDLRCILLFDAIVISILSIIISFVATEIIVQAIPLIIKNISYIKFDYPLKAEICTSAILSLITIGFNAIYFRKISGMMPADLLVDS